MKKQLLTLLISGFALSGFAQVTPPAGAVAPQASTADAPQWYAMMSSHMTAADRQNRWLYYDGSRLATEQYADGLDMQQENITQFAWRLEEYTDDYGMSGVRLINYDGEEVQVPVMAEAMANTQLLMVPSGEGSTWELMTSASTGQAQCAEMQYVLDWTGKTMNPHAYLNAMDGSVTDNAFGVTIYDAGAHQASGWFFVPLDIEDEPTEPASWTIVKSKRMSATSTYDVDVTDVITTDDPGYIGVFNNTDGSNGAIFDGEQSCYGMYEPQPTNFIGVYVNIEEAGTYKFNYRTRLTEYGTVSVQLVYSGTQPYEENFEPASDVIEIPTSTTLPAQQIESNEIELQAGEYLFALNVTEISYDAYGTLFVGDFNLYKKGAGEAPVTHTVTWEQPEYGTITVSGDTGELTSGATVESGTTLTATFTAEEGYMLSTVTLNSEDVTSTVSDNTLTFTVEDSDVTLAATFSALTWGTPGGTIRSGQTNYVTSATTTGATEDLSYTNDAHPGVVYINTGAGMTVGQGQSFDLHVVSTSEMKWAHAIVYVDWNHDYDFDDEGEQLFKVGSDVDDNDAPSDIVTNGNQEVPDFTRTINVPADAVLGTTRMRIQFTDAWHIKTVDHPAHSAMDDVDQGGVYDFDVTITEPQPQYTWIVVDSDPMSGTDDSWDKSESFRGSYANQTGPSTGNGAVIDGYSYCMGAMATQNNDFIGHYVEVAQSGTYKVSFSARLDNSGGASSDASATVAIYYAEGVTMNNSERRLGDEFTKAGEDVTLTLTNNLPATMVESQEVQLEAGTRYAFAVNVTSFKNTGYSTLYVGDFKLMKQVQAGEIETYTVTWAEPENGTLTVITDTGTLQSGATVEAGTSITVTATPDEGYELETLTVGGEAFTSGESYVVEANTEIVATFAEVPPTMYTVSWAEPVNGTLEVTVGSGITIQSGAVVEAGASITVTATPAEGYQLETLTVGGEALENGASYAVNSDVEIVATFVEESPWQLVASNLLSAETRDGVDLTNVNAVSDKWGVYEARTANGTVLDGKTWGYGLQSAFNKEQVMVEVNIEEAGEYKFSYRMRLDNNDPDFDERYAVLNLFYQEEGGSQTTVSDEDINLYGSTELPATQYESRVINLEPGTYSFGVNHVNNIQGGDNGYSNASLTGTYLFVGDFKLYKYNQEAQPDCTISWTEPENGTIEVSVYGTGETVENGATVPYGTTVDIVATPAAGYELEGITINDEPYVNTGFGYLVAGDLNIEATFVEVPVTMYTVSWTADNCDIKVETAEGTTVENGGEVAEGTELTITATAADGYELESLTVNGDDFENGTTWTVAGDVTIAATVRGTGLDEAVAEGIYYDAASQTLYVGAAQTLSVYDVTGRKVVEAAVDGTFDASALRGGIYIAVADGKVVKFRK